jgi:Tol biopolymer transport system component
MDDLVFTFHLFINRAGIIRPFMVLTSGVKLGPYEIQSPLGAGGMGEVYRARDTRLDRTVAVKILPSNLSSSPEAKQRFDREARAISSLNHPNICQLYDVGSQDGTDFLVMEFLEGETLADRLAKAPLPLEQILKYGSEICDGLEKAHRSGVVHRDLKPGNVMLTKAGAKLMDFGLAKAAISPSPPSSGLSVTMAAPAISHPLTGQGMVVGTFQYMSPEQIEGKEADARSDIFALGCVLYEMATGKRAFEGKNQTSIVAAILASEPQPISAIQPTSPVALDRVIRHCLAKDPDERIQTAHDVKLQLKWAAEAGSQITPFPIVHPGRARHGLMGWWVSALLAVLLIAGGVNWWVRAHQKQQAMYFNASVPFTANNLALSPDGRTVAMVAYSDQANKYVLWTYEVGARAPVRVPGTEDAAHPFWSPDSRSIAFFAQGKLKKVDPFSGTSAQIICDAPHGRGGTWNRDGVILFTPNTSTGLFHVSPAGGTPVQISTPDRANQQQSHRWPFFLPDGKHFLFIADSFGTELGKNAIYVGSLDSKETRFVMNSNSGAIYSEPGYLLYWKDGALVAQHFDLNTFTISGEPRNISDGVQYFPQTHLAVFSAAGKDLLVLQTGQSAGRSQFLWFDRKGKPAGTIASPGLFANPSLSPDGSRLAFEQTDRDGRHVDIWVRDLANDAVTRLTFGPGLNEDPVWSPDSKHIGFGSNETFWGVDEKNADGSGAAQKIYQGTGGRAAIWDWSRDGQYQLIDKEEELWYVSVKDGQQKLLLDEKWLPRNAKFSPDGKWVAYCSNETGNWEIFVMPFPNAGNKWQVSQGGGEEPRWRADGKELFYLSADAKLMAVPIKAGPNFEAGAPTALFSTHLRQPISAMDVFSYDVTKDGQRFLINTKVDEPNAAPFSIILNWTSQIEE